MCSVLGFKMTLNLDSRQAIRMFFVFNILVATAKIYLMLLLRFLRNSKEFHLYKSLFHFNCFQCLLDFLCDEVCHERRYFSHSFSISECSFLTSNFSYFWDLMLDVLNRRLVMSLAAKRPNFLISYAAPCFLRKAQLFCSSGYK